MPDWSRGYRPTGRFYGPGWMTDGGFDAARNAEEALDATGSAMDHLGDRQLRHLVGGEEMRDNPTLAQDLIVSPWNLVGGVAAVMKLNKLRQGAKFLKGATKAPLVRVRHPLDLRQTLSSPRYQEISAAGDFVSGVRGARRAERVNPLRLSTRHGKWLPERELMKDMSYRAGRLRNILRGTNMIEIGVPDRVPGYNLGENFNQGFFRLTDNQYPQFIRDFITPGFPDRPRAWHGDMTLNSRTGELVSADYPTVNFWDNYYEPMAVPYMTRGETKVAEQAAGVYFSPGFLSTRPYSPAVTWRSGPNLRKGSHVVRNTQHQAIVQRRPDESVIEWVDRIAEYYNARSAGTRKHETGHHLWDQFSTGAHPNLVRNLPVQTRLGLLLAGRDVLSPKYGMLNEAFARSLGGGGGGYGGLAWLLGHGEDPKLVGKGRTSLSQYLKTHGATTADEKDLRLLGKFLRLSDSMRHSPAKRRIAKLDISPDPKTTIYEKPGRNIITGEPELPGYGDRELQYLLENFDLQGAFDFLREMDKKGYLDSIPEGRSQYDAILKVAPTGVIPPLPDPLPEAPF